MSKGCKYMLMLSAVFGVLGVGLVAVVSMAQPGRTQTGGETGNFTHSLEFSGRTRTYEVHVPRGYDGKKPLPVILNMHGGGGNATVPVADAVAGLLRVVEGATPGDSGRFLDWRGEALPW